MMTDVSEKVYIRLVQKTDSLPLLQLEQQNKEFFSNYASTRGTKFYTEKHQKKRIKYFRKLASKEEGYLFVIIKKETKQLIGMLMLTEVVRGNLQSAWLGYFLDKAENGKGYMQEAVKQVLLYCFDTLKLHRIEAGVMPTNERSTRVLVNNGFQKEGLARQNVKIAGVWQDHFTFAILATDLK